LPLNDVLFFFILIEKGNRNPIWEIEENNLDSNKNQSKRKFLPFFECLSLPFPILCIAFFWSFGLL